MPFIGEPFRIFYIAKDFKTGLSDVRMVVYKPNLTKQGIYTLSEVNSGDGKGIYSCEYEDSDIPGIYLFVINSPSCSKKDARQIEFTERTLWSANEKAQIRDALGVTGDRLSSEDGKLQTIADDVGFIKDVEGGRWRYIGNQMVLYKADNITEFMRFNLKDELGNPSLENVFERERVIP